MAYSNVQVLERAQAKIEAVRGVAETTMTRWFYPPLGSLTWQYNQDLEEITEQTRTYASAVDRQLGVRTVRINIEINLTYEEAIWWLNCALDGGNLTGTTTGSTPPGFTYSLAQNVSADDLSTFTLKAGDATTIYKFSRCAVNQATFRFNPQPGGETCWRMTAEIWAIFVGITTYDSPTDILRNRVLARGTNFSVDTTTIGTTQVLGAIRSGEFTINNNLEEKFFSENTVDAAADFGRGSQVVTGSLVYEYLNDTEFALMRAGTVRKIRIAQTGPNIGSTPTTDFKWQVDVPNAKWLAPQFGYAGQNKIITLPFVGQWSSTVTQPLQISDVISAGTVTA
jgi:hypothetical protein